MKHHAGPVPMPETTTDAAASVFSSKAPSDPLRLQRLAHLLQRGHLDLADALGADAVLGGQLVQRHAAGAVVVDLQVALFHDSAAARVQRLQRFTDAGAGQAIVRGVLDDAGGLVAVVGQVGE